VPHHDDPEHKGSAFLEAAVEAEYETGHRELTEAAARRGVARRIVRVVAGFMLVGVGIAAVPLPGPGWLIIVVGLSILPFAWAERTIQLIRRRVPGVPEDGRVPARTWVVMGVLVVGSTLVGVFLGDEIVGWLRDGWQSVMG
jgi:hypothetical protein